MCGSRRDVYRSGLWIVLLLGTIACSGDQRSATESQQRAPVAAQTTPASATAVVSAALKTAAAERKVVLIEFGASWCTWCRQFEAFVRDPGISSIVAANYVVVNLVVHEREDKKTLEHPGGENAMNNWGGSKSGLPFYVFLNASGAKIADSNAMPDGRNVGFPATAQEVAIFLGLIDKTAPRMSTNDRSKIVTYLEATVKS